MKEKVFDIETRIGSFIKINDTLGEITFNGTTDATLQEVKDLSTKMNNLMENKPYYLVNNLIYDLGSFPPEVWHFLGTDKSHNSAILGSVVVTESIGYRMQIKFFFSKFKPQYPYTIVKQKQEAYKWIEDLRKSTSQ